MKNDTLGKKIFVFIILIILFIFGIVSYAYINENYGIGLPCVMNKTFGIYCPGCGLTRAGVAMINFDFYQAFRYNAFSFILIPLLFILVVDAVCEYIFSKSFFISKISNWFWIALFSLICGYGIIRNFIPFLQPVEL